MIFYVFIGLLLVIAFVLYKLKTLPPPSEILFKKLNDPHPHKPVESVSHNDDSNIIHMWLRRVQRHPSRGCYYEKVSGKWTKTTWQQFHDSSAKIAKGLIELGLQRGDSVSILGDTCGRWCELDVGIHMAGMVGIGVYPKQSHEKLSYQLDHSDTKVIFVSGEFDLKQILEACSDSKKLIAVVPWQEELGQKYSKMDTTLPVIPFSQFQKQGLSNAELEKVSNEYGGNDTAIMVYTSGTTGLPKGVMLSHDNLLAFAKRFPHPFDAYDDDLTLSFLPMAHIAERVISFYGRITYGMSVVFCSDYRFLLKELDETRPTLFGAVPRVFEKAHARVFSELAKLPGPVQAFMIWGINVGIERVEYWQARKPMPVSLKIQCQIAEMFCHQFLRRKFLGGRIQHIITGAAPISLDIIKFFWGVGLPVYEVYGQSEATAVTHLNHDDWGVKFGTVGKQMPGCETKIADDGEILIRAPWVFKGYYKNDEATTSTKIDDWLYSGDIGVIDEEGFLKITDRKKHIIITAGGKNIAPASIEKAIKASDPIISQVHPHGDKRPYCVAIIAPGPLETIEWGVQNKIFTHEVFKNHENELMKDPTLRSPELEADMAKVACHPDFQARIKAAVERGNKKLMNVEKVKAFYILDRDFSQEHGEMTPTMKVKRRECEIKFKDILDRLYEDRTYGVHFPVG